MLVSAEVLEINRRFKMQEQMSDFFAPERYQLPFYNSKAKIQIVRAGNRAGKTQIAAKKVCDIATHRHETVHREGPQRIRVVGESFKVMKNTSIPLIRQFIPKNWLMGRDWNSALHVLDGVLYLRDGGTFQFMSYEQKVEAFRGVPLDIVWNDEQGPVEVFDENLSRLGDKRGICLSTLTPEKGSDYLDKRYVCRAKPGSDIEYFTLDVLQNPHIDREYQIRSLALMPEKKFRIKLYGDAVSMEGLIFEEFDVRKHVVDPFRVPDGWQIFLGIDLGWRNPTAVTYWAISPQQEIFQIGERYNTHELLEDTARAIYRDLTTSFKHLQFRFGVIDSRSARATSRQTGETDYRKFTRALGMGPIFMSNCTTDAVIQRNNRMHELLMLNPETGKSRYKIFSTCKNTIYEFGEYSSRPDNLDSERNLKETPLDKNDHLMSANGILAEKKPSFVRIDVTPVRLHSVYRRGGII